MGPVEQLVLRAWGLGVRIGEAGAEKPGAQARSLGDVLDKARELDSSEIAHWRDRKTGEMKTGTPMEKAAWEAAEDEYAEHERFEAMGKRR
jgi:hypothetical protein